MTPSRLKLYLYPNAKPHVHDLDPNYINTVPFSIQGIQKYCDLVTPDKAEFFYMGQYSYDRDKNFSTLEYEYFAKNRERHIIDLEGDGGFEIPQELYNSIITVNGPKAIYDSKIKNLFVRPTFSTLLVDISKNRNDPIQLNFNKRFCFQGFINSQTRYDMFLKLNNQTKIPVELGYNSSWSGPTVVGSKIQKDYEQMIKRNAFSLCPRGSGLDSVRLIESCYFGRIPILISDIDYLLVDHKYADTTFIPRIISNTLETLDLQLSKFLEFSTSEIEKLQKQAFNYFETVIRNYMQDPTKYMIQWMGKQQLI